MVETVQDQDPRCESSPSVPVMKLSEDKGSGKISRLHNTTGVARPGDDNEAGGTPDNLERMWIGVVHPPRPRSRGCCCRRPFARNDCPLTSAHDNTVETMCNHAAVAAFLNSQSNKNNNENELFPLHARDGIKIVDRLCHPCQSSVPRFRTPDSDVCAARI